MITIARQFRRGQSLVEFALLLPAFMLLVLGIFEFSRAFFVYSTLTNAAREAVRYGIVAPSDRAGIENAAISKATVLGITSSNIRINCPDGSCTPGRRIQVAVAYDFTSVLPMVATVPIYGSAAMRIER